MRTIVLLCHCVYAKEFQTWLLKRGFRMGLSCFNFGISKRKSSIELKSTYMPSHQMHARIQKYMIISVGLIARLINKEDKLAPNSEIIINHPRPKTVLYAHISLIKNSFIDFFFFLSFLGFWMMVSVNLICASPTIIILLYFSREKKLLSIDQGRASFIALMIPVNW